MFDFGLIEAAFQFRYFKNLWNSVVLFINQVKGLFSSIKFIDIIDILFVAVILYLVIRIIRETRAIQLIKGIVLVAVLYFLVSFLGMSASSYLFKSIFSNILIIIVVLFGPEIRNVLEQMGKGAARTGLGQLLNSGYAIEVKEMKDTIDATCKACTDMADSKTGALIVFENETMLGEVIESGTSIEAVASSELIENIFFPKSPMHDGALIVRNGKLCAAGCILPLTRDTDISSSLGTRHRAAIGLSQQSDAIVFVVSEETGKISVAMNGALKQDISSGEIRDILTNEFIPSDSFMNENVFRRIARRIKK